MKIDISYIGKITIKSLRDYILDNELEDEKVIILNKYNFDDIILEHLSTYKESAKFPYYIIGTLIEEDPFSRISLNRIGVINDYDYDFDYNNEDSDLNFY
ncbi:hypothetical protein [Epilithonimonas xixisoli]|uniref:Uncharacterized protein n=1 Tax=Epilithonimonas xixisoli TaxID=1476462 RepID=A0A4R8IFA0_9FLAO|nr:hypothetical protein [Epilithonimonas xixisoli]TDX84478.1 hypothetical protein B0I22_2099 [Epilithonimonas xixisoli]